MKYSTAVATMAVAAATHAYVPVVESESHLVLREESKGLHQAMAELETMRARRDVMASEIEKREYQIVTDVLAAVKNTELAPEVINYFATNEFFAPIVVSAVVGLLKSGFINWAAVFDALDRSNLVGQVVNQLISDCSLYVELFNIAKGYIAQLLPTVKELIQKGISSLTQRELEEMPVLPSIEQRDFSDVVVNLMDSLAKSGLAAQVVRDILTDLSYLPFAGALISAVIASSALPLDDIVAALKQSSFVGNLLEQILTVDTFKTLVTNAFAAYAGTCASGGATAPPPSSGGSGGSIWDGIGGGSGTSTGSTGGQVISDPCKKRRRRRRSYNY